MPIEEVKLFPQGYSALALYPEYVRDAPSVLLVNIGGWTVDLIRLDNTVPNASTCRSLELGVIRRIDETAEPGLKQDEKRLEEIGIHSADDFFIFFLKPVKFLYVKYLIGNEKFFSGTLTAEYTIIINVSINCGAQGNHAKLRIMS